MTFHVKAWLAWAFAAAAVTLAIANPLATLTSTAALSMVAFAGARRAPEGRSFSVMLKLGAVFLLLRVVLFGLTGHTGDTTIVTLPELGLPDALGGFSIGGRITGEVVAQSVAEGLKIAAFLAAFGAFMAVVDPVRVLRMLPRRLRDAGLVVGIALTFVPSLLRTIADVRDAQRVRGHRFRGVRALRPLVIPVVASALERSLSLAASMEARGYGGRRATRMRPEPLNGSDRALIAASTLIAVAAFAARGLPAASWYPYPVLAWPPLDARILGLSVALVAPLAIGAVRAARLARASREAVPSHLAAPLEVAS